ncbi:MAG: TOBE domain-containing protein [Helicobacteraceae bacterium]
MNRFVAIVEEISHQDKIQALRASCGGLDLYMVGLDLTDLKTGQEITLAVKPTHVALGLLPASALSLSNQIECVVKEIKEGAVLSSLVLTRDEILLESVITTRSVKRLGIRPQMSVAALIKASDLYIEKF